MLLVLLFLLRLWFEVPEVHSAPAINMPSGGCRVRAPHKLISVY